MHFFGFSVSLSLSLFLARMHSLTHLLLGTQKSSCADCKYDYVRKYIRKKFSGSGMCIRTYASGTVRIYNMHLRLTIPPRTLIVPQRRKEKKEEEEREVEKKEKKRRCLLGE